MCVCVLLVCIQLSSLLTINAGVVWDHIGGLHLRVKNSVQKPVHFLIALFVTGSTAFAVNIFSCSLKNIGTHSSNSVRAEL